MSTDQKIAFITGANRGIGFETAKGLAEKGIHVVIGARKEKSGVEAAEKLRKLGYSADAIVFDTTDPDGIKRAKKFLEQKFGHLDILVNNAGIMIDVNDVGGSAGNNSSTVTEKIMRETFDTNYFGVIALTQALLPLLKKSKAGRIVNLSSILGSLALHGDPNSPIYSTKVLAYNSSKTALNAFTVHLAAELKDTPIKVNSAHPGWVKTDMGGQAAPMEVPDGAKTSISLSLLAADGPTGGFFHAGERLPW